MNSEEAAWAAGLIEGEGCFHLTGRTAILFVQMTDEEPIRRLATLCPGSTVTIVDPKNPKHKRLWRFYLGGWNNLKPIADEIRPWLCERRRNKLDDILANCARGYRRKPWLSCRRCKDAECVKVGLCQECYDKVAPHH